VVAQCNRSLDVPNVATREYLTVVLYYVRTAGVGQHEKAAAQSGEGNIDFKTIFMLHNLWQTKE